MIENNPMVIPAAIIIAITWFMAYKNYKLNKALHKLEKDIDNLERSLSDIK